MLSLINKALLVQSTISAVAVASWSNTQFGARDYIVEPSAAYQIYESDPDLTNLLGSDGSVVSPDTPSPSSSVTSSTVAAITTPFSNVTSFTNSSSVANPTTTTFYSNMTGYSNSSSPASPTATEAIVPHDDNDTIPFDGSYSNQTFNDPSNSTRLRRLSARSAQFPFVFIVSQGAGGANQTELVVAFNNLPCPPASYGPYSFEFNFVPEAAYNSFGNNQINMFRLPAQLPASPTFNNIKPLKGDLVGTFELVSHFCL